jgi:hypothetical protein
MDQRSFCLIAGIIFSIVAFIHALRILYGWEVVIGGWSVPQWVSWVALLVAGFLGYEGRRLAKKSKASTTG